MRKTLLTIFISFVAIAANAQNSVRCESDGRYRECELDGLGRIALQTQLSKSACVEGETWGERNGRIWVDRGCRAEFVRTRPVRSLNRGTIIVCESVDGRRMSCSADTRYGVTLDRQISKNACIEGRTWGYTRGAIWVDQGCRAEFAISGGGGGFGGNGRRQELIVCESEDGRLRRCAANTRGGVELSRQLSRNSCQFGRDWGYDSNGVWVTNGCRAEFSVRGFNNRGDRGSTGTGASANDTVGQLVRCESTNSKRTYCRADTRYGVQLYRQISDNDCVRNQTWGYDSSGIWVSGGCRADFEINDR